MELRYVMYGYFITYSISVLVFCNSVVTIAGKQTNLTYQFAGAETFGDGYSNENGSVVTSNRMGLPDNPLKISTLLKQPPQFSHSPQRECPKELAHIILSWIDELPHR